VFLKSKKIYITFAMAHIANPNETHASANSTLEEIREASVQVLLETVAGVVQQKEAHSNVFDSTAETNIPKFGMQEITLGSVLGRGGFCVVREIRRIKAVVSGSSNKSSNNNLNSNSSNMSESSLLFRMMKRTQSRNGRKKYVFKQIFPELKDTDKLAFLKGTVDLATEAKYLSALVHPNIILLCGASRKGPCEEGYFLVLEKLTETLTKKLKTWVNIDRQCNGITGVFTGSKKKMQQLYQTRLEVAFDIANGAEYLHEKNVVFRDLVRVDMAKWEYNGNTVPPEKN
jgi:serine/threonine protein kinase